MPTRSKSPRRDRRYRIAREYCGDLLPRHVVRFCGDWLGFGITRAAARAIVAAHQAARHAVLTGAPR